MMARVDSAVRAFWWRLRHDRSLKMLYHEQVEGVHAGATPAPEMGGGYWLKPVWRPSKLYICCIRVPLSWAPWFGYDLKDWTFGGS